MENDSKNPAKELSLLEKIEPIIIDAVAISSLLLPYDIPLPESWFGAVFIITIFYGLHNTQKPSSEWMQLIYGFLLIGAMLSASAVAFLITGSLMGALLGLFIIFPILLIKGDGGKVNPFTKLYEHPIRIVLIPLIFTLFLQATESILTLKVDMGLAIVAFFIMVLPIRILITFERPKYFYHVLTLLASLVFYTHSMTTTIIQSPTAMAWRMVHGQESLEDFVEILEEGEALAVVKLHLGDDYTRKIMTEGTYYIALTKNEDNLWDIDLEASKAYYEEHELERSRYEKLEKQYQMDLNYAKDYSPNYIKPKKNLMEMFF